MATAAQPTLTTAAVARHVSHIHEALRLELADQDDRRVLAVVRYFSAEGSAPPVLTVPYFHVSVG